MKKNVRIIAGLLLLCVLYVAVQLFLPLPIGNKNIEVQIPKGSTFRQAADVFASEHLLRNKILFLVIGRLTGIDRRIRAGYYSLYSSMNLLDLLGVLRKGQIIEYEVTVVEGDSLREVAEKLSDKNIVSREDFLGLSKDTEFLKSFDISAPSLEGYLYPETYKIPKGMDPREAVGMMINKMRERYSVQLRERAKEVGLSEREVLTLASIVEKEAVADEERPLISAVYLNRLKKGMLLQADPTAIYGVKSSKEKITHNDLLKDTPYNTYVHKGLPPGPIASPGIKSITAALYPAKVRYLFFVSNNDGTHHFSVSAEEHLAAVREYRQKKLKKAGEDEES
ncbi:MAG TPA: endolytic transglycosylase MltG [Thermodesulfovibrionales bacterium]|nr:endolytic transglycosylase MltG [Thermodesulfovibrionales bacterium]